MPRRTLPRAFRLRVSLAVAATCACLAVASLTHAQATIRSRDVVTSDWSTTSATPLPGVATPSWNQQPNSWRLGVAIQNLETGVLLTDVERGLPADNAWLVDRGR
jgi:hypothetical protein